MSVVGGIQGLHFINTMSNDELRRKSLEAEGIIGNLANSVKRVDVWAPLAAGAIFAKMSKEAYDFSKDYEMAMKEVQTISTATQDNLKGISDAILNISKGGPDGGVELSKAFYQIVSAGYDGAKGLDILNVASKAATAGLSTTATAADGLTTIINAWGLEAEKATEVADIMFKTVERGKTTFGELAANIAQVAPLAAANNIDADEIFAAIQTITKQGTSTSEAFTQIRSAIIGMNDALGDGWADTMTFQEGLQAVRDMAGGSQNKLKELIGRVEGVNAVLATTGKNAKGAAEDLNSLGKEAKGATDKAFGITSEAEANQWKMVWNNIIASFSGYGDKLVEKSNSIAKIINKIFQDKDGIQKVVTDLYKAQTEMSTLFGVLNDAADGTDRRAKAIQTINEKYGKYLENLLTEKSTLEDIAIAQTNATRAMMADVAVKTADQEIYQKMGEYQSKERNLLEDMVKYVSDTRGMSTAGFFVEDLQKGIDRAMKENPYNVWRSIYDNWIQRYDPGSLKFGEFKDDFMKAVNERIGLSQDTNEINQWVKRYRDILSELNIDETGGGVGGSQKEASARAARNEDEENYLNILRQIHAREVALAELTNVTEFPSDEARKANLEERLRLLEEIRGIEEMAGKYYENLQIKTKGAPVISGEKEVKETLKPMKQLTTEEQKQLEILYRQINGLELQRDLYEEISNGLSDVSEVMGALSFAVGEFDEELGSAIGKMADLAFNASSAFTNLSVGNIPGAIASGLGAIGNVIGLLAKNDNTDELKNSLDAINRSLEIQASLLASISGENWFALAGKQAADYKQKIEDVNKELNRMNIYTRDEYKTLQEGWKQHQENFPFFKGNRPINWSEYLDMRNYVSETTGWDIDKFIEAWGNGEIVLSDDAREVINEAIEAQKGLDTLYSDLTLLTGESLADSIIQGFKEGKTGMEAFASDFEDMMRDAVLNSLKISSLTPLLQQWNEELYNYMNDSDGLTETEIELLRSKFAGILETGKNLLDIAEEASGLDLTGAGSGYESQSGSAITATEESVSLLYGQLTGMRIDLGNMDDTMLRQLSIAEDSLEVLEDIRDNTAELHEIRKHTKETAEQIRKAVL
ncbi:phage tail tape measure protein [Maribellus comscasis]|uniref:Phage tail tape measure protein n=1 Tax=Maribellus comscasis TaxID=2681766 RepID=A0A6I6JYC8_9BACT|nr:phage tail tape measure protein [Maribellus comscasis]QGY44143.1 phage tail tape measure protein [Maribellus comscasis]